MKFYEFFGRLNWPRTYTGKILFVSFIGVHVPMFGAVTYVLLGDSTPFLEQIDVLAAMLLATLIGTSGTLFAMYALLSPVRAASKAAEEYLRSGQTPRLPSRYTDGAGVLMASVQECITRMDATLVSTEDRYEKLERDFSENINTISGMKHDFRTPLTHIIGFADLMKAEAIGPLGNATYQNFAQKIAKSGQQLLNTLNTMLDLSDSQSMAQMVQDSETLDMVNLAKEAVNLEHLHAEMRNVEVTLATPAQINLETVQSVAKNLLGSMLHTAISITPEKGNVALSLIDNGSSTTLLVESLGGQLLLEDVPPRLANSITGLKSGTGSVSEIAESATPMTLRLSLIDTLCRTVGSSVEIKQTPDQGFSMQVVLTHASQTAVQMAA
jgi:signal transduction histidine kinase